MEHVDLAIVGAGIMGLAHAVHAARAGLSVAVFDRSPQASGASVRNFGMLALVAQAPGRESDSARRALTFWQDISRQAGVGIEQAGCLFVAREAEEMAVLEEAATEASGPKKTLVNSSALARYAPNLRSDLLGGLWSPDAWKVDQRAAPGKIAEWLHRTHGVAFRFSTDVTAVVPPLVETTTGSIKADHVLLATGDDFASLFPEAFAAAGIGRCQLQMLRTHMQPKGWRLRPFILGGLSMTRYNVFASCPSLPALIRRQRQTQAAHLAQGVHVIACQEADGSVTIGDSHAYGDAIDRDRCEATDRLIIDGLAGMIALPETRIAERWLGHYAHLPGTDCLSLPVAEGVTVVTVTNGQGMTHALAVAETVIADMLNANKGACTWSNAEEKPK